MQPISKKLHLLSTLYVSPRIKKEARESKPRVRKELLEHMAKLRDDQQKDRDQGTPRSDSLVEKLVLLS